MFLRDGDTVYRTWHTNGRGAEQLSYAFALIDLLPYGRQEEWQDSPEGWPQSPTYSQWAGLIDKIVGRRRGGFCYELNGPSRACLSAWALG